MHVVPRFDVSPENVHAQSGMLTCPHAAILGSLRQLCGFHLHDAMLNVFHIGNVDLVANHDEV